MNETGATRLVDSLIAAGIKQLFTLSGNHVLSIFDATVGRDIALIHTRHEAAAVHMADAWGRLTGQPGVALVTAGPGHLNALSALFVAQMAESPLLLLSGHAPRARAGQGAFQEVDQVAAAGPVVKAAWQVDDPRRIDRDIKTALALAAGGRPGPVHLSLPSDVLDAAVGEADDGTGQMASMNLAGPLTAAQVGQVLELLADAARPLLLAGPAVARPPAWPEVVRLAAATGVPALPMVSPRGVDDPRLRGAAVSLARADLVLLLGKKRDFSLRFGDPPAFAQSCRFLQIDAEPAALRPAASTLCIHGDPLQAARQLVDEAHGRSVARRAWQAEVAAARDAEPAAWVQLRRSNREPLHPLRVCTAIQPFLDRGAIHVSDGGEFGQWAQAALTAPISLINGLSGAIGAALPLGLAARLAHPERPVIVTQGDGAFGFHALELDTALRYGLPVVVVVGNDARWNAEQQLQRRRYGSDRLVACDLLPSRYDLLAAALGGHGEFVQHAEDLKPALERAVASGLPACVNVIIESAAAPTFR